MRHQMMIRYVCVCIVGVLASGLGCLNEDDTMGDEQTKVLQRKQKIVREFLDSNRLYSVSEESVYPTDDYDIILRSIPTRKLRFIPSLNRIGIKYLDMYWMSLDSFSVDSIFPQSPGILLYFYQCTLSTFPKVAVDSGMPVYLTQTVVSSLPYTPDTYPRNMISLYGVKFDTISGPMAAYLDTVDSNWRVHP